MKTFSIPTILLTGGLLFTGSLFSTPAEGQRNFPRVRSPRRIMQRPQNRVKLSPVDPAILLLLRRMVRPTVDFSGEQITEVTESNGRQSRQKIWGDTKGRLRRDFLTPSDLSGDTMLTASDQYRYFHRKTNTLDVALWPSQNDSEKMLPDLVRQRRVSVIRVGQEVIAGRNADILAVSMDNGGGRQIKFWIDSETGIRLKQEISNGGGLVSRSYLTTVSLGSAAGVDNKTFEPNFPNVKINSLFPVVSRYNSVEEARSVLPFAPLLPASVPAGFSLTGVWVFPSKNVKTPEAGSVLLRYSSGIETFSLFERLKRNAPPANAKPPKAGKRSIFRWVAGEPGHFLEMTYVGHLSPAQAQSLIESVK